MLEKSGAFYTDTGADISVVKKGKLVPGYPIDETKARNIEGVTEGLAQTLGETVVSLEGNECNLQVVADDFPIAEEGIVGWDSIDRHDGNIDAPTKRLRFGKASIPFLKEEKVSIPARASLVISAKVSNSTEVGWVPLTQIHPDLLFGNFIAENKNGRVYGECINTGDTNVVINVPTVELIECETPKDYRLHRAEGESSPVDSNTQEGSIERVLKINSKDQTYDEVEQRNKMLEANSKARAERVGKIINLANLDGCNAEEKDRIKAIIFEYAGVFGLEGEPLPATHVIQHKITVKSDKTIRTHRYRFPPALREQMLLELQKLRDQGIVTESSSNYASPLWIVPKKADRQGNKKYRLVTDYRALNEETEGSCQPLPFTSDILEHLASANYIIVMDLKQGYY